MRIHVIKCHLDVSLELVTAQIPLHNTWKVPLVLTDLHLLWKAKFKHDGSSESEIVITNEDASGEKLREAKTFVQTSVVNEFYMLPGDRKVVSVLYLDFRLL